MIRFTTLTIPIVILRPTLALADPLDGITIAHEFNGAPAYDRDFYKHWIGSYWTKA